MKANHKKCYKDEADRERIFLENKKLIYHVINTYVKKNGYSPGFYGLNSFEDIEQIASISLWKALETYNPDAGFALSTYVCKVIRNDLYNELRNGADTIDSAMSLSDEAVAVNADLVYRANDSFNTVREDYDNEVNIGILNEIAEECSGIKKKGIQAIILTLRGYRYEDIAAMMETTEKNISAWVARARTHLRTDERILAITERNFS